MVDSISDVMRVDKIRLTELSEIVQNVLIIFVVGFYAGSYVDSFFPASRKDASDKVLLLEVFLQLVVNAVVIFYINKINGILPLLIKLDPGYKSGGGIADMGAGVSMSIIFIGVQNNFQNKVSLVKDRFALL